MRRLLPLKKRESEPAAGALAGYRILGPQPSLNLLVAQTGPAWTSFDVGSIPTVLAWKPRQIMTSTLAFLLWVHAWVHTFLWYSGPRRMEPLGENRCFLPSDRTALSLALRQQLLQSQHRQPWLEPIGSLCNRTA